MSDLGTVVWKISSSLLPFRTPVFHLGWWPSAFPLGNRILETLILPYQKKRRTQTEALI